jgi:hypothetical protein
MFIDEGLATPAAVICVLRPRLISLLDWTCVLKGAAVNVHPDALRPRGRRATRGSEDQD